MTERIKEHVEVIGIGRALVEIVAVNHYMLADRLLKTDIELVTPAGQQGQVAGVTQDPVGQAARARHTRENQILVVRRLEITRVGATQHCSVRLTR